MMISREFASASLVNDKETGVFVSQSFILMAKGDLGLASFLSQIYYWHLPSAGSTRTRLRVKKDGELWLVKKDEDWFSECFISKHKIKTCKNYLIKEGLIKTSFHMFNNFRTTHLTITSKFEKLLKKCTDTLIDYEIPKNIREYEELYKIIHKDENKKSDKKQALTKKIPVGVKNTDRRALKTPTGERKKRLPIITETTTEITNKNSFYSKNGKAALCDEMLNGLYCPICNCKQYETPSGTSCKNGHGGELGIKKKKKKRKKKSKTIAKTKVVVADKKDIDKWLDLFDYSQDAKLILQFWHECGGSVHKTLAGKKGANSINIEIESLMMDGLNTYSKVLPKELSHLRSKKWTRQEIISCINDHANTRFKPIEKEYFSDFIIKRYTKRKDLADRSPLVEAFEILESGDGIMSPLAQRLKKELSPLRPKENTSDKVFITAANNLEKFNKHYRMFQTLAVGYGHDPIKPFLKYVKLKSNDSNWKLGYISADFVVKDYGAAMTKNNTFEKVTRGRIDWTK